MGKWQNRVEFIFVYTFASFIIQKLFRKSLENEKVKGKEKEEQKMDLSFENYIIQLTKSPTLIAITVLILGVILVNGWTDAPNAIATCVSTRAIKPKSAIAMASVFNFLGVLVMTLLSSTVVQTLYNIANFGDNSTNALMALCAGLVAIVLWAVLAWLFGIPTSESHALVAGVSGAAIAIQHGISGINMEEWKKVLYRINSFSYIRFFLWIYNYKIN